jgi:NADPH2:quinone reductase
VLVRIEAAPINPSDLGLLFGPADMDNAQYSSDSGSPSIKAPIPPHLMSGIEGRIDQSLPVGNEGAGIVVSAGESEEAQALIGKVVGFSGGGTYSEYKSVRANQCIEMPEGTSPAQSASCFVNPMTVLGFVGTMRREGHSAMVHTAAASNLGQMLQKVAIEESFDLVNIVRSKEQEDILRNIGATFVCNSSSESFLPELTEALVTTGATLGFDATGGGRLASDILACMERAAVSQDAAFSRYGSTVHKQVYIYGGLDRNVTTLNRSFGMAWGIGGWLLTPYIQIAGAEELQKMRDRVSGSITTTFASSYTKEVSLTDALSKAAVDEYRKQATGLKFLINPSL